MAASGIAEHNEARRKANMINRRAFLQKALKENVHLRVGENPDLIGTSEETPFHRDTYEQEVNQIRKVGSPPGIGGRLPHDAAYVDKQRREELREQMVCEYSAKIPNRYTSIDYISQW